MEFVLSVLASEQQNCDPTLVPVVSLGTDNYIRINATIITLEENQVNNFLEGLGHKRFAIWKYSQHEDHDPSNPFVDNWSLFLAFFGVLAVFHAFGRSQEEKSYSTWSICALNVFRLSLGQPLRRDPKRWSMRFILISWVLFQMHAGVVYQGVLMSYEKSIDRHSTKYLIIPNTCLTRLQRLFETGHFKIHMRTFISSTLRASSQTVLLLSVAGGGWLLSLGIFAVEIWSLRSSSNEDRSTVPSRDYIKETRIPFTK